MNQSHVFPRDVGRHGRFLDWLPELSLLVATTAAGIWAAGRWFDPTGDPGIWLSTVSRLARGERLYRDLYLQFGPLSPALLGFGGRLFGFSPEFFLLSTWIAAVGAGVVLLQAVKPALSLGERFAVAGLLFSECLFAPGPGRLVYAYAPAAVHALLFSAVAMLLAIRSRRPSSPYLAGLFAGLAFCSKQEIGLACLVAIVFALALQAEAVGRTVRSLAAFSVVSLCGTVAVLTSAPIGSLRDRSHFWPLAFSPPALWSHLYERVAGLSAPGWAAVLAQSAWWLLWYVGLVAILGLLIGRERNATGWIRTAVLLAVVLLWWAAEGMAPRETFRPVVLSTVVAGLTALLAFRMPRLPGRTAIVALGVFASLVGARTVVSAERAGPYSGVAHFATAATWVFLLCVLVPRILPGAEAAARWARRAWTVLLLLAAAGGAVSSVSRLAEPEKRAVRTPRGLVLVDRGVAPLFEAIAKTLRPGETIWVLPEINGVDALFRATSVSPYPSHLPGWLDDGAQLELIREMEKNRPDVVILFSRNVDEYGVAEFGKGYDRLLSEWIDRNYVVVVDLPAGRILRLSGRGPA